ncbi:polyphenol oxidase family protein [bacterium]|nr:polyphenol oxidase family protein [bacterium]
MELTTIDPAIGGGRYLEFGFGPGGRVVPGDPRALLTTLAAGDMAYAPGESNGRRTAFFASIGIDGGRVLSLRLKHTRRVLTHGVGQAFQPLAAAAEASGGADGVVTADVSFFPALTVADCMPIWVYDRNSGAFGVLHSGWKGTGILAEAARSMASAFGSSPRDLSVILGPSIGPCCYAVPAERAAAFRAEFGEGAARTVPSASQAAAHRLDLRAANLALAESLGVGRVLNVDLCTACSPALGSYRRQGPERFTRMLALCGHV